MTTELYVDQELYTEGRFTAHDLDAGAHYDIVSGESGDWITRGIQGGDAIRTVWDVGDEAWPAGEEAFEGDPVAIASLEEAR
jgi:hypothetical protein